MIASRASASSTRTGNAFTEVAEQLQDLDEYENRENMMATWRSAPLCQFTSES